jgi:hypothetical protein
MKKLGRIVVYLLGGLLALLLVAAGISYLSNRGLDPLPERTDVLTELDKARLAEAKQLKAELGEQVWPGWGESEIPLLVWNRDYSFLTVAAELPPPWEPVPDDDIFGQAYYRRPSDDPQNFAVQVGDQWVGSLATKGEMDAFVIEMISESVPELLQPVVPYRLLIQSSEVQISGLLHESFHAFQALEAPARLEAAEAVHSRGDSYWQVDEGQRAQWEAEIGLLEQALAADSDDEARRLAGEFLAARNQRRAAPELTSALVDYERQLEWEEGLAKYVELAIWRAAAQAGQYQPRPELVEDPDFAGYQGFGQRWSQEVSQMKRQASRPGETRFYYTGMAQAMLLDRLLPGWQERALEPDTWLEELLAGAAG